MASKLFMEGKQLTGAVANALKINCKDKNGNKSTVQAELNKLNNEVSEQSKNLVGFMNTTDYFLNKDLSEVGSSYTATQNCLATIYMFRSKQDGTGAHLYINNLLIATTSSDTSNTSGMIPLKKGQTLSWNENVKGSLLVFGTV